LDDHLTIGRDITTARLFDAQNADEEKTIARRLNKASRDHVLYAPLGVILRHHARRKNVSGIVQAPLPLFWGVSKSA
jgi:peptide/nickel transport system substrate-binding protein